MPFTGRPLPYVTLILVIAGCPNSGSDPVELTEAQKTAVEEISTRVMSNTQTLSAALPAVDRVDTNQNGDHSVCPAIALTLVESVLTASLDYGEGCTGANQGQAFISGLLAISGDAVARSLNLVYDQLSIDQRTVDGEIGLTFSPGPDGTLVMAEFDVSASDHGMSTGVVSVLVNFNTGQMTMTEGILTFVNLENETSTAVADALFYDPVAYGNLIPAAGTITFEVLNDATTAADNTVTIVVTFDENSPATRAVRVTVEAVEAGTVTLPDVTPAQ